MTCVVGSVHATPSGEMEPTTSLPMRSQRTQYGKSAGAVPLAVLLLRVPVSTRYSTVTSFADAALKVTGMFTVPALSSAVALVDGNPTCTGGTSSSLRYIVAAGPRLYAPGASVRMTVSVPSANASLIGVIGMSTPSAPAAMFVVPDRST